MDSIEASECSPDGFREFKIVESAPEEGAYLPISPDMATCSDCLAEMHDPQDRRYRYPFINCTNCGPRFTIIKDIPYDRPRTTMAEFPMCPPCQSEYDDPADRRFHAQPVACPDCGPHLWLAVSGDRTAEREEALQLARQRIADGGVVAVKGLGGFHLACDATNSAAVATLRQRKHREGKPFALMAVDLSVIARHAEVSDAAGTLLASRERPIILLAARRPSAIAPEVAPGRDQLGFMLPYTPLHNLLLESAPGFPDVLVMTSANMSDEPIVYRNDEAVERLGAIADAFLLHDRAIHMRTDDSVAAEFKRRVYFFRRSRGYAPAPIELPLATKPTLAVGGEIKNTFCLTRDERAFLSHHVGDLDYAETYDAFESGLEHFERLFRVRPELVAYDLHPDYRSTRYALHRADAEGLPAVGVQHHHAHIASCMADNGLGADDRVIGVSFDGTGYGRDGAIWGGEFLIAGYRDYERPLHLAYCPLPGGDAAIRRPYRTALSWLRQAGIEWQDDLPPVRQSGDRELALLASQLRARLNTPPTSSVGRLFDAAASLAGVCHEILYEAQAACEFEAAADREVREAYPFEIGEHTVDPVPAIRALAEDVRGNVELPLISARFHQGLASMVAEACWRLRGTTGLNRVALSGGTWQNMLLLDRTVTELERLGLEVLVHHRVPANDAGLALGQAVVAATLNRS
jgi:hydrogenase maturation protein HypF